MMQASLFPLVSFQAIDNPEADDALKRWGHWLGACNRPFGRQSFGLFLGCHLVAVAVSASTVNARCGGFNRCEVVELARLCADPCHRDMTRVALRLWRKMAPACWTYWQVVALVSYANAIRHKGDIYRFDGWTKVAEVKGGAPGVRKTNWKRPRTAPYEAKTVWVFDLRAKEEIAA